MNYQATGKSIDSSKRFDRSSWITLVIGFSLLFLAVLVLAATYQIPSDGWLVDRGLWGRYETPEYLGTLPGINPEIQTGDVLVEVDGTPFEVLESQAAVLDPLHLESWEFGATVNYLFLRDGVEVAVPVTLQRGPLFPGYRPPIVQTNLNVVADLIVFALGALLFGLRPKRREAQLLFLFATTLVVINLANFGLPSGVSDFLSRSTYWPRLILADLSWFLLLWPLLLHLFLTFPVPKKAVVRKPRIITGIYFFFAMTAIIYFAISVLGYDISGETYATAFNLLAVLTLAFILIHSVVTIKDPIPRMQMRWIAFGALIGIAGTVLLSLVVELSELPSRAADASSFFFWYGLIATLFFLTLPACLAIAILRYRLWDIEIIINRSLVYGSLTVLLALIYFGSVVLLEGFFRSLSGQGSPIAIVISTLVIAGLFSPLRRRVQEFIDRRFYRRKYDAEKILERFAESARDETDLRRLTDELYRVAKSSMQAEHVSIWLKETISRDA